MCVPQYDPTCHLTQSASRVTDEVFLYKDRVPQVLSEVREATEGAGVDVVYDGVGFTTHLLSLNCVKVHAPAIAVTDRIDRAIAVTDRIDRSVPLYAHTPTHVTVAGHVRVFRQRVGRGSTNRPAETSRDGKHLCDQVRA